MRPKIVASTATVRRAESQIRALFNRRLVDIFPPPGPDRRDSFFAETLPSSESNARLYVGVAAQGRSPKVVHAARLPGVACGRIEVATRVCRRKASRRIPPIHT